ncbi:MAG: bifunctional tetrahydrofolate synthase/dihydrofolate synthase [Gammaproteobacteria bacterium]|nr:bifunctional tetrahydrofolate synthase/dihydrofolate synthase [Gammaproteobacteria bacterium]
MAAEQRSLEQWLAYIQTVHFRSIDMGLDRVRVVLQRLASGPTCRVIAVAGTNGKGSCAAMLGGVLAAAGHRVGVYTSPHLVRFNERILVAGRPVTDDDLCRAFALIDARRGETPLTYFEFATLAAVYIFEQARVDFAVMEVGMGGRLDAVNALPIDAALITNVDLDHTQWLGRDREAIGREKAHIMRPGRTAVFNHPDPPHSVLTHAADIETYLLVAGRDYGHERTGRGWRWSGPRGEQWDLAPPAIPGEVQVDNASGVLALLSGLPEARVDRDAAGRGLASARIHGRCEIVAREPMVMVDVAHNRAAVETLKVALQANPVPGRTLAVFGMLRDKDPEGVARAMDEHIDAWFLATIDDERGQDAAELAPLISSGARGTVHCYAGVVEAYRHALAHASSGDRIVVFGSFHIAGDILDYMKRPS